MSIAIRPTGGAWGQSGGAGALPGKREAPQADSWLDALAKLVPGEVILAFTAALQVPGVDSGRVTHLVILIVFAILTPIVLLLSARRAGVAAPTLQYLVRTLAFVLYALGSDAVLVDWLDKLAKLAWIPRVGALVVTLLAALVLSPVGALRPPRR